MLHVSPFFEPCWGHGGMARASAGLCRALVRRGHEVTVVTARLDPAHPAREDREGIEVVRLPVVLGRALVPWAPGLARLLRVLLPGCGLLHLHGHRSGMALAAARAARRAGVPWIAQPHGTHPHHGRHHLAKRLLDRLFADAVLREAAAVLAVSEAEARDLPRPARVVGNGVESPPTPGGVRRDPDRLLFVGNASPQKRSSALPPLLARLPRARLRAVGPLGPAFDRQLGRQAPRVERAGVLDPVALASEYASAALLVHPAVGEAFGMVPFEAALGGTPAVVAGGHGCGEVFAAAGGCVVPPDEPEALADAVSRRLDDPARGQAEAAAVAAFARCELTWDRVAAAVEAAYREVVGKGPTQRS